MSWNPSLEPGCPDAVGADAIETLIVPRARDIGDFEVRRALPAPKRQMVGPFIFFDQAGPAEFVTGIAIHRESAVAAMVDGLRILLRRINPCLEHFKQKEVVFVDETSIGHFAFEIGKTLDHQRRRHALGRRRRQTESLELLHVPSRAVANTHNLRRKVSVQEWRSRTPSSPAVRQSCNRHCSQQPAAVQTRPSCARTSP